MMRSRSVDDLTLHYDFEKVLGEGSMGRITRVRHKITGKYFALKTIQLLRVSPDMINEMSNEINVLKSLDHPNIIRPLEMFQRKRQICFIMELCSGGDLYARQPYTEAQAAQIMTQIASAVLYMHSKGVCHRDIKFENLLFESTDPNALIKFIDFGLAARYVTGMKMEGSVGTLYSMAPEVLRRETYTQACDLWSVGVVAYMLLSSQMPFTGPDEHTIVSRIYACNVSFAHQRWNHISSDAKDLIMHLLLPDPSQRLTAEQLVAHPWLQRSFSPQVDNGSDLPPGFEAHMVDSFRNYAKYSKLKKAALMVVAHQSTPSQIASLRKAFQRIDTAHNGKISFEEFQEALSKHGLNATEIRNIFRELDVDQSGCILYTEFLAAALEAMGKIEEERLAEAFDRLDADDSGFITVGDLRGLLGDTFDRKEVERLIDDADYKQNGKVDLEEFMRFMTSQPKNAARQDTSESLPPSGSSPLEGHTV